jgi:nucleoside-diphosphate-sugar epimerase
MRKPVYSHTGAGGEIGHGLRLAGGPERPIITLDVAPLDKALAPLVTREFTGSITDVELLDRMLAELEVDRVFHLAALLSTRAEFTPMSAHHVNVEGTLNLLEFAQRQGESHGRPVVFVYPSSVAAYGLPDAATKSRAGRVREDDYLHPTTMYGCNKLYYEKLERYYALHYKQLAAGADRCRSTSVARFPVLISAKPMPSGGTSDFAYMIHAAARGESYACFVRPDTVIPFMTMPDAINALLALAEAPRSRLTRTAYNVAAFSGPQRRSRRGAARVSHATITTPSTRSGRPSSIRGLPTWMIRPRDATGASTPARFQTALSASTHPDNPSAIEGRPEVCTAAAYNSPFMSELVVTAFAPATVSNVSLCGFDVLGFPMEEPGDTVSARLLGSPGSGVEIDDIVNDGGRLPRQAEKNTAGVAARSLLDRLGEKRGVALTITKGLPLSSGLGGSAASAAAAVVAVNALIGGNATVGQLIAAALDGERLGAGSAHPDNIASGHLRGLRARPRSESAGHRPAAGAERPDRRRHSSGSRDRNGKSARAAGNDRADCRCREAIGQPRRARRRASPERLRPAGAIARGLDRRTPAGAARAGPGVHQEGGD